MATENTVLGKLSAIIEAIESGGGGGGGGGDASEAEQILQTAALNDIIGHVDGIETLFTALNALVATEATLAALSAKLPASLGSKTGATSLSVVNNSDVGGFQVVLKASTGGTLINGATPGDSLANAFGLNIVGQNMVFNGTNWTRQPGDLAGIVMQPYSKTGDRIYHAAQAGGIVNSTAAETLFAAAAGALRNYCTGLQIDADVLGVATEIAIRDGAGGTVLWRGFIPTSGISRTITFPVPLKGTANTLMEVVTLTASGTGAVYVNAQGYTAA